MFYEGYTDDLKTKEEILEIMASEEFKNIFLNNGISNVIKISALNSKFIIIRDKLLNEAIDFYDRLCKEDEEFWYVLDREVLGFE